MLWIVTRVVWSLSIIINQGHLDALGYRKAVRQPLMSDGDDSSPALIADLDWIPQGEALFDVRFTDTGASSYVNRPVAAVLASAEEEKLQYIFCLF